MLGAMSAGGMYGDSTGLNSTQSLSELETDNLNASKGLEYIGEESEHLKNTVSTEIMVMSMWEGPEEDVSVSIQNTGQREINTTAFTLIPINKRPGPGNCFKTGNSTMLAPEEVYFCDSGLDYPNIGDSTKFRIVLDGTSKDWVVICQPRRSSSSFC